MHQQFATPQANVRKSRCPPLLRNATRPSFRTSASGGNPRGYWVDFAARRTTLPGCRLRVFTRPPMINGRDYPPFLLRNSFRASSLDDPPSRKTNATRNGPRKTVIALYGIFLGRVDLPRGNSQFVERRPITNPRANAFKRAKLRQLPHQSDDEITARVPSIRATVSQTDSFPTARRPIGCRDAETRLLRSAEGRRRGILSRPARDRGQPRVTPA
jgi:hypothetical protein